MKPEVIEELILEFIQNKTFKQVFRQLTDARLHELGLLEYVADAEVKVPEAEKPEKVKQGAKNAAK